MKEGADAGAHRLRISVIVPAWRDTENLRVLLPQLARSELVAETIVVDALGDPDAAKIARECGAQFLISGAPNRGAQMNHGARQATGDILIFQHADTKLTDVHLSAIESALRDPALIGGAFYRKFDGRHPHLMWLEHAGRLLSRWGGTLYGDQSIFIRREVFQRLQGFAEIPLMEDMEFSRRLRAAGRVVVLDPPLQTSARRHLRESAWGVTLQNGLFILLYKLGVSPARLHRWYYKHSAARPTPVAIEPEKVSARARAL